MKCQDCQELFSLYLDGEIDPSSRSGVDAHLSTCRQCGMEWRAFKTTVAFLRDMPKAQVPPDFLAGIRQKIETQTPWQKFKTFLFRRGERQLAFATAFAMLVIGFATASLLQMMPYSPTGQDDQPAATVQTEQMARNDRAPEHAALPADAGDAKGGPQDFYPGIPRLAEYAGNGAPAFPQLAMTAGARNEQHVPVVDFVSTGPTHSSSSYLDEPFTSLSPHQQPPVIKPDLQITIHPAPRAEQMAIVQQIVQSPLWRAELHDHNTLLLSVPANSFDQLLRICCAEKTSFSPEYARNSRYISMKRYLTVAVRLD
ncbi:MAG: zf-HC2 domain-containing protein [Deltaproteobacteria bacterium]|nr:zf-HC2 domain-containing protein [Deltaproteobacteria bacterium]